jgi:SAM-dependent methyltransferase
VSELERFYRRCARFYDGDYEAAGYDEDLELYVDAARRAFETTGRPVLEMGCGTGRVLLPTARAGVEVVGLELSQAMLDQLEAKLAGEPEEVRQRVRLVQGDIRDADLGDAGLERGFSLVTAPFRVVQHLVTRDDQRRWLRTVHRCLAEGGELLFDVFLPDYSQVSADPELHVDVERVDPETGEEIRRVASADHSPHEQTFEVRFEWLVGPVGKKPRLVPGVTTTVRWFTRAELENLLELERFQVVEIVGDFDRHPVGPDSTDLVVRARRLS